MGDTSKEERVLIVLNIPAFLILTLIGLGPFVYCMAISLTSWNLASPASRIFIGFKNYFLLLSDERLWNSLKVTLLYSTFSVGLQIFGGSVLALLLWREFRGSRTVRALFIVPMMMTPVVVALIWRVLYDAQFGLINYILSLFNLKGPVWLGDPQYALLSIIVPSVWRGTPFAALIILAGLFSLPTEPFEAAIADGASSGQLLRFITLPLLKPYILIALLFRIIYAVREFDVIYVLTGGGPGTTTETMNLYSFFQAFEFLNVGYGAALSVLSVLITATATLVLIKTID